MSEGVGEGGNRGIEGYRGEGRSTTFSVTGACSSSSLSITIPMMDVLIVAALDCQKKLVDVFRELGYHSEAAAALSRPRRLRWQSGWGTR